MKALLHCYAMQYFVYLLRNFVAPLRFVYALSSITLYNA